MKKNMGTVDRAVRVVVALVLGALILTDVVSGTLAVILGIVAVIFLLTSMVSFCPLYAPFHISTRKEGREAAQG